MKQVVRDFLAFWDRFFFGEISLLPLGVFRLFFGLDLLIMYAFRHAHWRFYFTDEGFVQSSWAMELLPEFYRPIIGWYPTTPMAALIMHSLLLVSLFFLTIGMWGRWMAALALFLHLGFMQRNFAIAYGADVISSFFLFYLALTDSSRCFSLESWLKKSRKPMGAVNAMMSTMGVRLAQIQLCLIYGYTGLEKMKGGSWWEGTAVWTVFGNQQIMMLDLSWLAKFPLLIALMTHSVVFFEIYFPVLIWLKATRRWTIAFGWLFHLGIGLFMGLVFFAGGMMSVYLLFFDPDWLRVQLGRWLPERLIGANDPGVFRGGKNAELEPGAFGPVQANPS